MKEPSGYYGEVKETQWSVWPTWESWTWPGHEGKDIQVEVYSRYPAVRLYLNNRLIGEQPTTRHEEFKAVFTLPYQPGELRAVGVENGKETDPQRLETAGKPARIRLTADRTEERMTVTVGALKASRKASDEAYRTLVKWVNALALIEGEAEYADFIDYVNTEITHYKREVIGQKADAADTSGGSDTPVTPPEEGGGSDDGEL